MPLNQPQILFVEDDSVFRTRVARSLRMRGFDVLEADTVVTAKELIKKYKPQLALLDLCVGEDSGLSLLGLLQRECSTVQCVVLTGYGTISTAVSALKAGAANYLTKPVHVGEILEAFGFEPQEVSPQAVDIEQPTLLQVEWEHIQRVLDDCNGNVTHAATRLGVHRRTLQRKLSKIPTPLK